ncbi:tolC [Symbiodinium necroappetens]|uniref:TolC protein n=1 Tax=Symbiodinium necroappetens TaxID=1628268 RepID=A0A812ME66_9DINO|nr:tolC [Symbiodinium necroappetens]
MRSTHAARTAALATLTALAGCAASPFATTEADRGVRVDRQRLESIERFDIDQYATMYDTTSSDELAEPVNPFLALEEIPVSLEQARAWTLGNNLDLQVTLVDPVIANTRVEEEEAAWEWTFLAGGRFTNTDQPTATTLSGNQVEFQGADLGLRIPLRTGGVVDVSIPFSRTETDNIFTNPTSTETDVSVSIVQPLLRNAGRRTNTHALRIQSLEAQITEAFTKLEVIRQLAEADRAYWTVYATQEALRVAYEQYQLAVTQLDVAKRRFNARVVPEVEVVRAEEGVAQRIFAIINAQNSYQAAQRNIKRIMNVDGLEMDSDTLIVLASDPDPVRYNIEADHMIDAALAQRMELLELELRLAQDYSTIEFQKNQALPLATLDYTYRSNGLGTGYTGALDLASRFEFEDHSVGFNVEVPIGNEAAEARVHRAILSRLQRLATKDAREQAITREVLDTLDAMETTWQRIVAAQRTVVLSQRVLQGEQNQFEAGTRTSTEVLDAATRLAEAQIAEIRALVDYQISQVDLAFATGTLLGASRVRWQPVDPRGPEDFYGDHTFDENSPKSDHGWD